MTDRPFADDTREIEWVIDKGSIDLDLGPGRSREFIHENALAHLLINEAVFINTHPGMLASRKASTAPFRVLVLCSDVFAWGCADCEEMAFNDLETVWRAFMDNPMGTTAWCVAKRKMRPVSSDAAALVARGYDLDRLIAGDYHLPARPNP